MTTNYVNKATAIEVNYRTIDEKEDNEMFEKMINNAAEELKDNAEQVEEAGVGFLEKMKKLFGSNYKVIRDKFDEVESVEDLYNFKEWIREKVNDKINRATKRGDVNLTFKENVDAVNGFLDKFVTGTMWIVKKIAQKLGQAFDWLCERRVIGYLFRGLKKIAVLLLEAGKVIVTIIGDAVAWTVTVAAGLIFKIIDLIKGIWDWIKSLKDDDTEEEEGGDNH